MFDYFSILFWYRFIFLIELIICETLFIGRLKKKKHFWIKLVLCICSCFLLTALIPIPVYNWAYTSFIFLLIFIFTLISLILLYNESIKTILFCSIAGYSTQHICFQTFSFLNIAISPSSGPEYNIYGSRIPPDIESVIMDIIIYAVIFIIIVSLIWYFLARKIKKDSEIVIKQPVFIMLALVFVLVSVVMNAISTYNSYTDYSQIDLLIASLMSIIICLLSLEMQFLSSSQISLEKKLNVANHIIHEEFKQYKQSKQNIELINLKCHDLKHQIRNITKNKNIEEHEVNEITSIINFYDSNVKTGNDVLDVILTEKSLECNTKSISLTCLIDGSKLNFMMETDIYSLFGNAFDNAIEASMSLESNRRVISLTSSLKNNLFFVVLKNYTNNKPVFIDNLPQTTKADKNYHGFGVKSIQHIVKKYNGHLNYFYEDNVFTLSIVFELDNTIPNENSELI